MGGTGRRCEDGDGPTEEEEEEEHLRLGLRGECEGYLGRTTAGGTTAGGARQLSTARSGVNPPRLVAATPPTARKSSTMTVTSRVSAGISRSAHAWASGEAQRS